MPIGICFDPSLKKVRLEYSRRTFYRIFKFSVLFSFLRIMGTGLNIRIIQDSGFLISIALLSPSPGNALSNDQSQRSPSRKGKQNNEIFHSVSFPAVQASISIINISAATGLINSLSAQKFLWYSVLFHWKLICISLKSTKNTRNQLFANSLHFCGSIRSLWWNFPHLRRSLWKPLLPRTRPPCPHAPPAPWRSPGRPLP